MARHQKMRAPFTDHYELRTDHFIYFGNSSLCNYCTAPFALYKSHVEIVPYIIHEHLHRRGLEHGLLVNEVARTEERMALFVINHFAIDLGGAFRQKVCGNEGMTQAFVHDFHTGQAVGNGEHEVGRIGEILPPPAGTEFVEGRVAAITDGWLVRQRIIIDFLCGNQVERRVFKKDIRIRPFLVSPDDGQVDVFFFDQFHQAVAGIGGKGNFNIAVLIHKSFQDGRHMGLGKGLAGADAKDSGNGIRLMGDVILHILVLLQFLFRKGKEAVSGIGKVDPLIGTDEKRAADFLFHLAQTVGQGRLGHEKTLGHFVDASFFTKINEDFPISIIH